MGKEDYEKERQKMTGNLPDDVTPGDIDRHFGEPETRVVHGTVEVAVSVETQFFDDKQECEMKLRKAAMDGEIVDALDATVEEIEPI